jgi:hypothetical protein
MKEDKFTKALEYALFAPIIVHPLWTDIPDRLKTEIKLYRLANALEILEEEKAHEIEALAYLCSSSMVAPLRPEFYRIYVYLFNKYFGNIAPDEVKKDAPKELNYYEKHLLDKLRSDIFKSQMKALKEKRTNCKNSQQSQLTLEQFVD